MRNIPITLSLPENLVRDLHLYVSRRSMSKFVAQQVEKGIKFQRDLLAKDYIEASKDTERNAEMEIWDTAIGDGLDETNAY